MSSSSGFILRILGFIVTLLFALSAVRYFIGETLFDNPTMQVPLKFSDFLESLQIVHVDFTVTLKGFVNIAEAFNYEDVSFWEAVLQSLVGLYELVALPIRVMTDLFLFVSSVFAFLVRVIDLDFLGLLN